MITRHQSRDPREPPTTPPRATESSPYSATTTALTNKMENQTFQVAETVVNSQEFQNFLNNQPGLLILREDSWTVHREEGKILIHLKFLKKDRLKRIQTYFPRNELNLKRLNEMNETPPERSEGNALSQKIIKVHREYEVLKSFEEKGLLVDNQGCFYGDFDRSEFDCLLSSFAALLVLKSSSWSHQISDQSFLVCLKFLPDFTKNFYPPEIFGAGFIKKFQRKNDLQLPLGYDPQKDNLKFRIEKAFEYYMEAKKVPNRGRPKKEVVEEEQKESSELNLVKDSRSASSHDLVFSPSQSTHEKRDMMSQSISRMRFELPEDPQIAFDTTRPTPERFEERKGLEKKGPEKAVFTNDCLFTSSKTYESLEKAPYRNMFAPREILKKAGKNRTQKGFFGLLDKEKNKEELNKGKDSKRTYSNSVLFTGHEDVEKANMFGFMSHPQTTGKNRTQKGFFGILEAEKTQEDLKKGKDTKRTFSNSLLFTDKAPPSNLFAPREVLKNSQTSGTQERRFRILEKENQEEFKESKNGNKTGSNNMFFDSHEYVEELPENERKLVNNPIFADIEQLVTLVKAVKNLSIQGNGPPKERIKTEESLSDFSTITERDEAEEVSSEKEEKKLQILPWYSKFEMFPKSSTNPEDNIKLQALRKELAEHVECLKCVAELTERFKTIRASDDVDYWPRPREQFYVKMGDPELQRWWNSLKIVDKRRMWGIFFTEGTTEYWENQPKAQWKGFYPKKRKFDQISQDPSNTKAKVEERTLKKIHLTQSSEEEKGDQDVYVINLKKKSAPLDEMRSQECERNHDQKKEEEINKTLEEKLDERRDPEDETEEKEK